MVKILKPVTTHVCTYSIKDRFKISHRLNEATIRNQHLASMDVAWLFTNVAFLEPVAFICDYVEANDILLKLPSSELNRLMLLCTGKSV